MEMGTENSNCLINLGACGIYNAVGIGEVLGFHADSGMF